MGRKRMIRYAILAVVIVAALAAVFAVTDPHQG